MPLFLVADFTASGKQITKGTTEEFPLDELLSRLREKYTTVIINATAVVAMAAVLELCEATVLRVAGEYCKNSKRAQIGKNDIKWAITNDADCQSVYEG
jgi:histone H3/H4